MNDMSSAIIPKSDQINADDLIAGPMTITIRDVQIKGGQEQPVSIYFDGSDKAFRPCKSMSRVLVGAWGADAKVYIGRSLTLYRDPTVKWGGLEVGGIRISHMSDIDGVKQMMLTATKGSRKPFKVLPLVMQQQRAPTAQGDAATKWANGYIAKLDEFETPEALQAFIGPLEGKLASLESARPDLHEKVMTALATRTADLKAPAAAAFTDDDFSETSKPDVDANSTAEETPEVNDEHPGKAIADRIIAEINAPETNAVMDVSTILNREAMDIGALSDADAVRVEIAADKRRAEIRTEQAKAKETAE